MKKYRTLVFVFFIIWVGATGFMGLLGHVLDRSAFQNWKHIILLGFTIAFIGVLGPILTDNFKKRFKINE